MGWVGFQLTRAVQWSSGGHGGTRPPLWASPLLQTGPCSDCAPLPVFVAKLQVGHDHCRKPFWGAGRPAEGAVLPTPSRVLLWPPSELAPPACLGSSVIPEVLLRRCPPATPPLKGNDRGSSCPGVELWGPLLFLRVPCCPLLITKASPAHTLSLSIYCCHFQHSWQLFKICSCKLPLYKLESYTFILFSVDQKKEKASNFSNPFIYFIGIAMYLPVLLQTRKPISNSMCLKPHYSSQHNIYSHFPNFLAAFGTRSALLFWVPIKRTAEINMHWNVRSEFLH